MAAQLIRKLTLIFLVLAVSAAGFCGFFLKWSFRDDAPQFGFTAIMENTSVKPFIYRQLIPQTVKAVSAAIPESTKEKLSASLTERRHIESRFARAEIPPRFVVEYYLMFALCFVIFFAAIWILRALLTEVTQDSVAGTLSAMLFALIFPFFEVLGGYYYDLGEVFFFISGDAAGSTRKIFSIDYFDAAGDVEQGIVFLFTADAVPADLSALRREKICGGNSGRNVSVGLKLSGRAGNIQRERRRRGGLAAHGTPGTYFRLGLVLPDRRDLRSAARRAVFSALRFMRSVAGEVFVAKP